MIGVSGVRSSWLMFERNSVFIRSTSRSRRMSRSTYTEPTTSPVTPVSGPVLIETGTSPTRSAPDHDDGPPARSATGRSSAPAAGTPNGSSAAWLNVVTCPSPSTAMTASPMPASTASSRLRRRASSSAACRSSAVIDWIEPAIESNAVPSTPTSSSVATAARTPRSPAWMPSAARVRRPSPTPMRSPTASATSNPISAATRATRKSDRKRLRRVESTAEVGVAETIASTGRPPLIAPIGRAATNVPPLVADASPAPDSTDRASRSAAGGGG